MGESRVVRPSSKKLELSQGDWIIVRTKLSAGERHDSFEHMYLKNPDGSYVTTAEGRLVVGPANSQTASILAYLIDWSLTAPDAEPLVIRGQPLDVVKSMLRSIDEDSFNEIRDAITAHEAAITAARQAQKKIQDSKPDADPISSSPSTAIGASSGSVN
jgi:hypothetical protein